MHLDIKWTAGLLGFFAVTLLTVMQGCGRKDHPGSLAHSNAPVQATSNPTPNQNLGEPREQWVIDLLNLEEELKKAGYAFIYDLDYSVEGPITDLIPLVLITPPQVTALEFEQRSKLIQDYLKYLNLLPEKTKASVIVSDRVKLAQDAIDQLVDDANKETPRMAELNAIRSKFAEIGAAKPVLPATIEPKTLERTLETPKKVLQDTSVLAKKDTTEFTVSKPLIQNTPQKVVAEKAKPSSMASDVRLVDPIETIVKDRSGRTRETIEQWSAPFVAAFANAIIKNAKTFEHENKLYDRETGRQIPNQVAVALGSNIRDLITKNNPELDPMSVATSNAVLNKKAAFIFEDKLYKTETKSALDPVDVIIAYRKEYGINADKKDYAGYDRSYLISRANSILNQEKFFTYNERKYETATGFIINPNGNSEKGLLEDYVRNMQFAYNRMDDHDTVVHFIKDNPKSVDSCSSYIVIDKKKALLTVHNLSGEILHSYDVLLGKNSGDMRMRYVDREKGSKATALKTNLMTGAGIFVFNSQDAKSSELMTYDNEKGVQALSVIAPISHSESENLAILDSNSASDNRATNGDIRLRSKDFESVRKFAKPGCKFFVLPEEEGLNFVVKNNKLNFTASKKLIDSAGKPTAFEYDFSPKSREYYPIVSVEVDAKTSGRTRDALIFLGTLQVEKKKLMKVLNLDNDDYNELVRVAFAVLGSETNFGRGRSNWILTDQYLYQENCSLCITTIKLLNNKWLADNGFQIGSFYKAKHKDLDNSRGLTQIKKISEAIAEEYPYINKSNLNKPENAAIATMAFLADALNEMKIIIQRYPIGKRITPEVRADYLGYIYKGLTRRLKTNVADPDTHRGMANMKEYMKWVTLRQAAESSGAVM